MKYSFLLGIILLSSALNKALADNELFTNSASAGKVVVGDSFKVVDDKFHNATLWSNIDSTFSVDDYVYFEMNEDTTIWFKRPFICTATLLIRDTVSTTSVLVYTKSLTIKYDTTTGKYFKYSSFFHFKNGHAIKIIIQNINYQVKGSGGTYSTITSVPPGN